MEEQASQWVSLSVFPTTYKQWIAHQMLEVFAGQAWIEGELRGFYAQTEGTQQLEEGWRASREVAVGSSPESKIVDPQADRLVTAICGNAENVARATRASDPDGVAARTILKTYFPGGSAAITRQSMIAQLGDMRGLVAGLSSTHAAEAAQLGLTSLVGKLGALLPEYGASLGNTATRAVSFPELLAARAADQDRLALIVARLLVRRADHLADADAINAALARLRATTEKLSEQRGANRNTNVEINPRTGEPVQA